MSCFWDAILNKIKLKDFQNMFNLQQKPSPQEFADLLKLHNKKTIHILWNSQFLTDQQLEENYQHIREYNSSNTSKGYDCSTCDPFLFLICEIFHININHIFLKHRMDYCHTKNIFNNNYTIKLQSDKGHMW